MIETNYFVVAIQWRIKPDQIDDFLRHWRENNTIGDRSGLIVEFLSQSLTPAEHKFITWNLDPESLGDHMSFVTVGIWISAEAFEEQVAKHFNDSRPLEPFEKYRRRRVAFEPKGWRIGEVGLPAEDSDGVQ